MLSHVSPQEVPATVIRVENLWCGYAEGPVIKGISFRIKRGEFIGILGPNGSGKTTLLLALSGVAAVQDGRIEVLDSPIERLKPKERACRMAMVTQDGDMRFPFSCEEVVRMGRYPHQSRWRVDASGDERAVRTALRITDTQSLADRLVTAISGGEKQRVAMARVLAQETPILLLDEATSAMDIHRKLQIFRVLERLNRDEGLTVVAVLHDINLAALFCRRMLFLKEGEMVADGPTDSVLTSDVLRTVYRTEVLVQEIPNTGKRQVVFLP